MNRNLITSPQAFKILSILAETSSSEIYEVKRIDSESNWTNRCVLKILKSKTLVHECIHEFESLMKVRSVNCVRVFSWEWIDSRPAIVMEYVKGLNLEDLKINFPEIKASEIEWILQGIYRGLCDLSVVGMLHGDLHPRNVLISEKGEVKLIDYGMANFTPGMEKFTPEYSAPEVRANRRYSFQSDLYSLGKVSQFLGLASSEFLPQVAKSPSDRVFTKKRLNPSSGKKLGQKVRAILNSRSEVPVTVRLKAVGGNLVIFNWKNTASLILFSLFFVSSFALAPLNDSSLGKVSVKTLKWVSVEIDQQLKCSSPCEGISVPAGDHQIKWTSQKGSGVFTLTVKPGEHKVLKDKNF